MVCFSSLWELSFAYHGEDGAVPTLHTGCCCGLQDVGGLVCLFSTFPLSSVLNMAGLDVPPQAFWMLCALTDDTAPSPLVFLQISVSLCPGPVPGTGSSVLTVGKVFALRSTVCLENILLIIWDLASSLQFLFTALLSLNTETPLFTVLYFYTRV